MPFGRPFKCFRRRLNCLFTGHLRKNFDTTVRHILTTSITVTPKYTTIPPKWHALTNAVNTVAPQWPQHHRWSHLYALLRQTHSSLHHSGTKVTTVTMLSIVTKVPCGNPDQ
jgi:hypothetical protein